MFRPAEIVSSMLFQDTDNTGRSERMSSCFRIQTIQVGWSKGVTSMLFHDTDNTGRSERMSSCYQDTDNTGRKE